MPSQNTESFTVGELVVPEPGRDHLALWLKADAGVQQDGTNNVIGWSDQSGNSNHAGIPAAPPKQPAPKRGAKLDLPKPTAPQLAAQAINGKPAIRFTGDPGLEIVPRSGWPTKDTTVFAVVRCPRKTGNGAILGGITKGASPFQISMPAMTGDIGWNYGLNMVVLDFTNDEMPKLLECSTVDGAARIIHVDGGGHEVLFKERKPAASPPVTDDLKFLLGNSLEGDLAELLVYDRPLATAERHRVGFYLSQKYGIPSRYSAASAQVVGLLDLKRRQSIDGITVEFASGGRPAETPPCTV